MTGETPAGWQNLWVLKRLLAVSHWLVGFPLSRLRIRRELTSQLANKPKKKNFVDAFNRMAQLKALL